MQVLIKNPLIVFPGSPFHGQHTDLLVQQGIITEIGKDLHAPHAEQIDAAAWILGPGLFDLGTAVGDPGFEHREDLISATKAALAGGFTGFACLPNTNPALHSKSEIVYIRNFSKSNPVEIYPIGALSQECQGKDITEMYDMHAAGAVAFSDGKRPVQDSGLMLRALQYVIPFGGLIINTPLDKTISPGGQMHEGIMSTALGLRGLPSIAEELMLKRDIYLADYSESRLHVMNVSTKGSVSIIKQAKSKGLQVTASVAAMNLVCDDSMLEDFDSNLKVMPPLRSKEDQKALLKGIADGTIDCITTNHTPLDAESKNLEFPYADFGAIGLESAFALNHTWLGKSLGLDLLIDKWALSPRRILGIPLPEMNKGKAANFMLFNPEEEWTFGQQDIYSKSTNTPFIGWNLKGRIKAVIHKEHTFIR
jgi:dihydroorotase